MAQKDIPVIGLDNQVHDLAWARSKYGVNALTVDDIAGPGYRLVMAQEVQGLLATQCTVLNSAGAGVVGVFVNYMYPEPPGHVDTETTHAGGVAEHTMGPDEQYFPHLAMGPVSWAVRDSPSQRVRGLGWLSGTNHEHMNIFMQWTEGDGEDPPVDPPEEPPDEPPDEGFMELMERLVVAQERIAELLEVVSNAA